MNNITPSSAATLFYNKSNDKAVAEFLREHTELADDNWKETTIIEEEKYVRLTRIEFMPGNKMAVTQLKILAYLKRKYGQSVRADLKTDAFLKTDVSIGIVLEPNMLDVDSRTKYIEQLLQISNGILFDGETLINAAFEKLAEDETS